MDNTGTNPELLTPADAAEICRYKTVRPIYAAIAAGELAAYALGREYRIAGGDFAAWLASKRIRPTAALVPGEQPSRSMRDLLANA